MCMCGCVANWGSWRLNILLLTWYDCIKPSHLYGTFALWWQFHFNSVECACDFSHVRWSDQPLFLIHNILESKKEKEGKKSYTMSGKKHQEHIFYLYKKVMQAGEWDDANSFKNILDSSSLDEKLHSHAWSESLLSGHVSLNWFVALSILHLHMDVPVVWHIHLGVPTWNRPIMLFMEISSLSYTRQMFPRSLSSSSSTY